MDIPAITGRLPEGAKRRKYIDAIGEWEAAGTKPPSGNADACTKATGDGRIPTRRTRNPAARMARRRPSRGAHFGGWGREEGIETRNRASRAGVPRLCVKARSGRWLTLQGALTEAKPEQPNGTMIFIEPTGPREITWLRTSVYGLSQREREVVDLVLRGTSRKQIAKTLYISEYTVQDHLSNIFDKVGVRGRRALIKRLFFDNLYPQ